MVYMKSKHKKLYGLFITRIIINVLCELGIVEN